MKYKHILRHVGEIINSNLAIIFSDSKFRRWILGLLRPGSDQEFPRWDEVKGENTTQKEREKKRETGICVMVRNGTLIASPF